MNDVSKKYYQMLFALTFVVVLFNLLVGFFSVGVSLDEISREWRLQLNVFSAYFLGGAFFLLFIFGVLIRFVRLKFYWQYFYAYSLALAVSWFVSRHVSPMLLIGMIFFALYSNLTRGDYYAKSMVKKYNHILSWYQIIPVFLIFLDINFLPPFYWFDGFRGMAFDRVEYAFFVGLAFITLIIAEDVYKFNFWFLLVGLSFCAILSQTRFLFLSIFLALIIYWGINKKLIFASLVLMIVVWLGVAFGERGDILVSGRSELYVDYFEYIKNNAFLLVFGASQFYQSYNQGDVPHNFILQSILNWGLMGLVAWLIMIGKFYFQMSHRGKALVVYLFSFGLFHPGVDAYLVTPTIALVFLVAMGVDKSQCFNYGVNKNPRKNVVN